MRFYMGNKDSISKTKSFDSQSLQLNNAAPFRFPCRAAKMLGDLHARRYDDRGLNFAEAEMRIREYASMMGLINLHDDPPQAA